AHLETEILIVDEVLAVGDVEFQKKCLGKMQDVAEEGRTVLFVSHNMAALQALCRRGVLLCDGVVHTDARIEEAVEAYLALVERSAAVSVAERTDRRGRGEVRLVRVEVSRDGGGALATGRPARFAFAVDGRRPDTHCTFTVYDQRGQAVANFSSSTPG